MNDATLRMRILHTLPKHIIRPSPATLVALSMLAVSSCAHHADTSIVPADDSSSQPSNGTLKANVMQVVDDMQLVDAMQLAHQDYVVAVIDPVLKQFVDSATALKAVSESFERAPTPVTLSLFRVQLAETAQWRAVASTFDFGPIHSLGYAAQMDTRLDIQALSEQIKGGDLKQSPTSTAQMHPWAQGFEAMHYLLEGESGDKPAQAFTDNERRYLSELTTSLQQTTQDLRRSWTVGIDGFPAYHTVLSTAGTQHNRSYLSVHAASEEILRGVVNALDGALNETFSSVIEAGASMGTGEYAEALSTTRAILLGTLSSFSGRHIQLDSRTGQSSKSSGLGFGHWVEFHDSELRLRVHEQLVASIAQVEQLIAIPYQQQDDASRSAGLLSTQTSLALLVNTLEGEVLPLTQLTLLRTQPLAGHATTYNRTSSAYEEAPPNLSSRGIVDHDLGDEAFEEAFVATVGAVNSGLGPIFNNTSCGGCHIRNGRGMPVAGQLLLRVGTPEEGSNLQDGMAGHITSLGAQIQDFSIAGVQSEAFVDIKWIEQPGQYPDGTEYSLRYPRFAVELASNSKLLPDSVPISPRVPPAVYGLGLLEAIAEHDILALADPDDQDGDGISGRPNRVLNVQSGDYQIGRFGWKANSPTLLQQSAEAYVNDMGIHNSLYSGDDSSVEISHETLRVAAAYAQTLAVPARAAVDDEHVLMGEALFGEIGCAGCHVSEFTTSTHEYPALENQVIKPYTDMLLHDMGESLADHRPDHEASGSEWRTPALWGIGLAQVVLPYSGFLHDGRARTFEEAILWHGGEGNASREAFKELPASGRQSLLGFLYSL